jgi:hypothetical protein
MVKAGYKEKFLDKLFDRFKLNDREEIDLQDFVIGLAVLSRISFLDKIICKVLAYVVIFYLTDLDEGK